MLCEHGADPNQFVTSYIFEGETPLHVASGEGYREIVEILIKHGADPSLKSWSGKNAATIARHRDHNHLADWLETVHPTSQDNQ
jgi:ankyrin repeat protein